MFIYYFKGVELHSIFLEDLSVRNNRLWEMRNYCPDTVFKFHNIDFQGFSGIITKSGMSLQWHERVS